jgi:uncharacterized protein (TIGR02246 family)
MTTTREAFETATQAFNAHDVEGFAQMLAEDAVFDAPGDMHGEGKSACVDFYSSWFDAFPDAQVEVRNLHVVDDTAVEEGIFTGTHEGVLHSPDRDILPTGRPVRVEYVQVLRFRDGKHASFKLMFDRLAMLEQLELAP